MLKLVHGTKETYISMFCSSEISLTDFYGIIYTHVEAHSHNSKLNLDFHGNYTGIITVPYGEAEGNRHFPLP